MLRRRSVRLRIVVLVLVPVIALIGLYSVLLAITMGSLLSLRQAASVRNDVTQPVSAVQLQVSIERKLALQYLAYPSHFRLGQLLSQEAKSDAAVQSFTTAASTVLASAGSGETRAIRAWSAQ